MPSDKVPLKERSKTNSEKSAETSNGRSILSAHVNNRRTLLLLAFAIIAGIVRWTLYNRITTETGSNQHIDDTLKSMLSIEGRVAINKDLSIAVGFGSCLDIVVSSKDLISDRYQPPDALTYHENIRTQQELNEVFAYFFAEGAAAERYIDNKTLFQDLVEQARSIDESRRHIGGNAPVMAKRFVIEGVEKVILGTQHSKETVNDYDDGLLVSGPTVENDDVHICIEYPVGEKWGKYVAPRANRLIIHSDYYNPSLKSVDNFLARLMNSKLDLLVIGGLQMMDNLPIAIETRRAQLAKLSVALSSLPAPKPRVHLELASFTEEALLASIKEFIMPHVDSLGMNEQELPTLLKYLSGEGVNTRSAAYPRVASTLDQMRQLYQLMQKPSEGKLSRIHTHTIAFQAIMTRSQAGWKNTLTSSVKAALTAHRFTCGSHEIDMAKARLIMDESYTTSKQGSRRRIPFNPKHPVVCWNEELGPDTIEICVAPVLVCTKVKQTAGAGDNVSAAGLVLQI